jgi:YidC/Oxa1 family membrane protein insertase
MEKNRNYFIAIALSVVIVLAWQFLYMNPRIEQQRRAEEARQAQQQTTQQQQPAPGAAPGAAVEGAPPASSPQSLLREPSASPSRPTPSPARSTLPAPASMTSGSRTTMRPSMTRARSSRCSRPPTPRTATSPNSVTLRHRKSAAFPARPPSGRWQAATS